MRLKKEKNIASKRKYTYDCIMNIIWNNFNLIYVHVLENTCTDQILNSKYESDDFKFQ